MAFETILCEVDERGVCTLTLNRPDKGNAVSEIMQAELLAAIEAAAGDAAIRVVVLSGRGRNFCTGGDLDWFMQSFDDTREGRIKRSAAFSDLYEALNALPKPLIGRVNGSCFGGGMGLIAVCDTVLALASAKFGFTETRIGLVPASFSPYVISRIGVANARRTMLSGALFPAQLASRIGLVDEVCGDEAELNQRVSTVVEQHLVAAPAAVAMTKRMLAGFAMEPPQVSQAHLSALIGDAWETGEAKLRLAERLDKPKP